MNATTPVVASAAHEQPHPSPHRARVGRWAVWFPMVAAPLAWNLQLLVNVPIVAHGCYPHDVPLDSPIWSNLGAVNAWVEALSLLICVIAGLVSWRTWLRTRDEKPGTAHQLIESGDGRTRFMAMVGMLTSCLFIIAVAFAAATLATVPPCGV